MERDQDRPEIIELASVSAGTKGPWGHYADDVLMQNMPGLAED